MLFEDIALLTPEFNCLEHQYVGTRGKSIAYISDVPPKEDFGQRYDGRSKLMIPGLVNAHSHSAMTLLRGYAENLSLSDWLNTRVFPFEAKLTGEDIYWGALLAFAEMLRFGTVSVTDMYFFGEDMAHAVLQSGVKCNMSLGVTCFDSRGWKELTQYSEYESLRRQSSTWEDRLRLDMCIHGEYTSTPRVVREAADYAGEHELRMHIHLSETRQEHQSCKERHGKTPAAYFESLGLFDVPTTAAHCVWLEERDFDILKEKGVTAASCPASNCKLASGFCDVPRLLGQGINVALGTDGAASNNSLNMLADMKLLALLPKVASGDPTVVTAKQALRAATLGGALSQGRTDCGSLCVGNRADLAVLDLNAPSLCPVHDMASHLVYAACGSEVCLTMVDGAVLYRDGAYPTMDLERISHEVRHRARRIAETL